MKKLIVAIMTCFFMVFSLFGCQTLNEKDSKENKTDVVNNESSVNEGQKDQADKADQPDSSSKQQTTDTDSNTNTNHDASDASDSDSDSGSKQKTQTQKKTSRLYYYDVEKEKMFYVDKTVELVDGAYINALTNALKNNQKNEDFVAVNVETFVTSAKLVVEKGILKVYFNDSFDLSTDLDSKIEPKFIESLVNTYGYNYNVEKVALFVNKEPYKNPSDTTSSGYFKVSVDDATEYVKKG